MSVLEVFLDFKSPGSYLALAPTLALVERQSIVTHWHPLQTRQEIISESHTAETRGETHRRVRALSRQATHLKYAAIRGLPMVFPATPGSTDLALGALLLLDQPIPFLRAAFNAYWSHACDLSDFDTVRRLLQADNPLDRGDLEAAVEQLEDVAGTAQALGIPDAPAYVYDEQVYVGREHLPVIEALMMKARA